ncbi:bifunctional phosphopantothenoylcysteine decarboxylase/phosphopantothenate--cysteine ligase CoaBC [Corynebacterium sp. zg912]|uniref:Coenzyme A biosynthesis bifunctional protein CoaBC n=1 Tax=Corynebacterium wankanglinii TaxID=2735136 RepID=A0A7H0K8I3_9CORY|nr:MULTISPECIES: bifunctional phosphopantothenoylcysteine decarboxylase/phosphopantothenate--cysteine ligase CoaBC [Corynebacterium]MBA1837007.1 bifunctional phosphopantothenoylcysteine decarboxylase/phosphopantothenate--cysteine ligase CoaBC [Corynebacterium wankanglinii]MCR5927982.1 bifunctional phosphopantothenoylcysteine decarboxylase/phosphopantothenate--cysteine ligase CoaBC [Corynebacterium sp. zg912]QNP93599.1 bifunctional phosphopantothenoylcysteine decarboxylase/phosphopantothenate--cy
MSEASNSSQPLRVVVGVSGGIAAYKACHLVREFKERGDDVRVIPTENALNFVGAATFEALSGNPVDTGVFSRVDEVQHVRLGQEADLVVVAPATADFLARVAAGRADDLLTSTILVATCPVVLAPAMHTEMWRNPATQANVATLRKRGITVLEPAHGRLTGKDTGPGRLPEPQVIAELARTVLRTGAFLPTLAGTRVVISAGGTRESIDPVRFIGNHSSGKQGFALGDVAAQRGASVTIVAGATDELEAPSGAEIVRVRTTRDMQREMMERAPEADVVVMAAAVADFRPAAESDTKLKKGKSDDALATLRLTENPDILKSLVEMREDGASRAVIIGFAAETDHELENGRAKLARKGADMLMLNSVAGGGVFGQARNRGWLLSADGGVEEIPDGTKHEVAVRIWDAVERLLK